MSPLLCMAITALFWPRTAYPALPPASTGSTRPTSDAASSPDASRDPGSSTPGQGNGSRTQSFVFLPPIRVGGTLAYNSSRSMGEGESAAQNNLLATLRASTDTFIWQPWFSQVNANIAATFGRDRSSNDSSAFGDSRTDSVSFTGYGQLKLFPVSRFPFELHIDKTDSRVTNDLVSVGGYTGQRVGFSQRFISSKGEVTLGWDRAKQDSDYYGTDQQDSLRLNVAHSLEKHRIMLQADRTENKRLQSDESTTQSNLTIQHSYTPTAPVSVENMANVSRVGYKLGGGDSETQISQLSTVAFWRPGERPMTVTGSARVLNLDARNESSEYGSTDTGMRAANLNLGLTYDLSRHAHLNASANVNINDMAGKRVTGSNQVVGVSYQPESKKIGEYNYNWGTSANVNNSTGGTSAGTALMLQLSHSLNRHIRVGENAAVTIEVNQGLSSVTQTQEQENVAIATKHISHGASLSWSMSEDGGSAMVRLSASDSRALDGNEAFFQLINLQASSSLPTGGYTSWGGSLTIQAVRQGGNAIPGSSVSGNSQYMGTRNEDDFVTTSSGSVTYQNGRLFGIRRLRFVSDLRMNSQALLPMFGGPQDQEMAAWENRIDYWIGRTQLRVNTLIARVTMPTINTQRTGERSEKETRVNKSIMFSVQRSFGDM